MEKARPEKSLHVCVGFYPNGHYVVNYVRHEDRNRNVAYNRTFRPGRAYFVDGEWACGGGGQDGQPTNFVKACSERIKALDVPEPVTDSRPYC